MRRQRAFVSRPPNLRNPIADFPFAMGNGAATEGWLGHQAGAEGVPLSVPAGRAAAVYTTFKLIDT